MPNRAGYSYSALGIYSRCPLAYCFKYETKGVEIKKDFTEVVPGNVGHELSKIFYSDKLAFGSYRYEIFDTMFEEVFLKEISKKTTFLSETAFAPNVEVARERIRKWVDNLVILIKDNKLDSEFVICEPRVDWRSPVNIADGVDIHGGFDMFLSKDKHTPGIMVDIKFSNSTYFIDYNQLYLYAMLGEAAYGIKIKDVMFLLPKLKKVEVRPLLERHKQHAIIWASQQINGIRSRKFFSTPGKFACRLCDFRECCKDFTCDEKSNTTDNSFTMFTIPKL